MFSNWSKDEEMILGCSNDNSLRLWSVETGRPRHTLTGHIGNVN